MTAGEYDTTKQWGLPLLDLEPGVAGARAGLPFTCEGNADEPEVSGMKVGLNVHKK
jgi:hypothetical protein